MPRPRLLRTIPVLAVGAVLAASCSRDAGSSSTPAERAARREAAPATVTVRTFASIRRLTPLVRRDDHEGGSTITLEAARGEREAGQLAVWLRRGSPRVVVEPGALRGEGGARIDARQVRVYLEETMVVEHGSPAGRSGTYVDPLIPAAGRDTLLERAAPLLAWVDVAVPVDATPGAYRGSVWIRRADRTGRAADGDAAVLARVPVKLVVRRATIPHVPTLASHVGLDANQLARFEGVGEGTTQLRDVVERYAGELADARLSIGDVGALPPGAKPGERGLPGDDEYLERVFSRRGVASVRIPFYLDHPFADPLGRDRAAAVAYLRAASRWARTHGWADRAYVFAIDEPDASRAGEVRELHELVHEADPRLRLLVTTEATSPGFAGSVDIWAPNISPRHFSTADVVRERAAGRDTWWYPSITTWQPYPDLFIDELRPTPRALGWLAWRSGVRGILYWTATHWQEVEDPHTDPGTYNEPDVVGNGDGVLLYPGGPVGLPGTPIPSVRLLQLRDGMEDHDLLVAAACAATPEQRRALDAAATVVAPALDQVGPSAAQVATLRRLAMDIADEAPRAASGDCRSTPE